MNELEFFREEMIIFDKKLEHLSADRTAPERSERLEFYRNQFARFRDGANQLEAELKESEKLMAIYANSEENADLDAVTVADHSAFKDRIETFKTDYLNLKQRFRTEIF